MLAEAKAKVVAGPKRAPCARCGGEALWEAWKHPLCGPCHGAWMADSRFSSGAINAALAQSDRPEDSSAAALQRYEAEATRRTSLWVKEARRG